MPLDGRPVVKANVGIASGVLLVVPDAKEAAKYTAMPAVMSAARAAKIPWRTADPEVNTEDVAGWVWNLPTSSGSIRVLVTGPRGTRCEQRLAVW